MNSVSEMVDAKEVGKDVDATSQINLNDALTAGEAKDQSLSRSQDQETQNDNMEVRAAASKIDVVKDEEKAVTGDGYEVMKDSDELNKVDSDAKPTVVETEAKDSPHTKEETLNEKANQGSVELLDTAKDTDDSSPLTDVNDGKGPHDGDRNKKLNSNDNGAMNGADETCVDAGAIEFKGTENEVNTEDDKMGDEVKSKVTIAVLPPAAKINEEVLKTKLDSFKTVETKAEESKMNLAPLTAVKEEVPKPKLDAASEADMKTPSKSFLWELSADSYESGTEEEQAAFLKEVEKFYRENHLEFKAPKFYKEELNLLKLWRAVIKLGGYEQVTSCKLWRQVGESFRPPKTCTTVSWTFRIFYEKALLEFEKYKQRCGELPFPDGPLTESIPVENQASGSQPLGSGRARRDAAARAMQGWHSQRLLDNGQVCQPIIKDKNLSSTTKNDKQLKTNGLLKRKKPSTVENVHVSHMKTMKTQAETVVMDVGPPADWVKINVQRTSDCYEIYALVPGLLREEVHVQSDPAGRLIISGQPEQLDNPWGVTPFKKVVNLPSRIDPHQTSAVVTLHGQLFVRVPFEQSDT